MVMGEAAKLHPSYTAISAEPPTEVASIVRYTCSPKACACRLEIVPSHRNLHPSHALKSRRCGGHLQGPLRLRSAIDVP
jgi:hypothetical protein